MSNEDWSDDPLVRALRAPGTPAELTGEHEARSAYRAAFPRRSGRRVVGRLGLGGTAVVTTLALTSGVGAAAYTNSLPDPIQDFAHTILGPVGVPPAPRKLVDGPSAGEVPPAAVTTDEATVAPDPTAPASPAEPTGTPDAPDPTGAPDPKPTDGPRPGGSGSTPTPDPQPDPTTAPEPEPTTEPTTDPTPDPTTPPTTEPSPDPTSEPTPDPTPRPKPGALSATVSATKVSPGSQVQVSGILTDRDGVVLAGRTVRLVYRTAGGTWTRYAETTTSGDGAAYFTSPALTENVTARLVVNRTVHSTPIKVKLKPTVSLSAPLSQDQIDVVTSGGQAGDVVVLFRKTRNGVVEAGRATLAADGTCSFAVTVPKRQEGYGVRLDRTRRHLVAGARIRLVAP